MTYADGTTGYSLPSLIDPADPTVGEQWVVIWRDLESYPTEAHMILGPSISGEPLEVLLGFNYLVGPKWVPQESTYYACDSHGDRQSDPSLWGDATVFWHIRHRDQHQCWVGGKFHEIGTQMGCQSLHEDPTP